MKWILPGALAVLSPIIPLSVRYLTFHYDVLTINAFRMTVGGMALLVIAYIFYRKELMRAFTDVRQALIILLLSTISLLAQHAVTEGIRLTPAVMSQLMNSLGLPLTILFAFIFFRDERTFARKPGFWVGAILSICGALGIALISKSDHQEARLLGVLFLLIAVVFWVFVGLIVKGLGGTTPALVIAGISALQQGIAFIALSAIWGHPEVVLRTSLYTNAILLFSGIIGVLVGTGLAFIVAQRLGVIVYQTTNLIVPVLTGIMGFLLLGEALRGWQILFGVLLILGSAIIIRFAEQAPAKEAIPG